jgi:hypothetical protein
MLSLVLVKLSRVIDKKMVWHVLLLLDGFEDEYAIIEVARSPKCRGESIQIEIRPFYLSMVKCNHLRESASSAEEFKTFCGGVPYVLVLDTRILVQINKYIR